MIIIEECKCRDKDPSERDSVRVSKSIFGCDHSQLPEDEVKENDQEIIYSKQGIYS